MEKIQIKPLIILLISFLFLFNCSTSIKTSKDKNSNVKKLDKIQENNTQLSQITDIPIPEDSIIDLEKTLIVGEKSDWMGRVSLISKKKVDDIYNFFLNEMIKFSYEKKSSTKSDTSTLIFENNKKAIFIKISELNLRKTYIEITATPVN